jgi:hypothetical protein
MANAAGAPAGRLAYLAVALFGSAMGMCSLAVAWRLAALVFWRACVDWRGPRRGGGGHLLIALSGFGQASDKDKSASHGFDLHLVKPIGLAELLSAVDVGVHPAGTVSRHP